MNINNKDIFDILTSNHFLDFCKYDYFYILAVN